MIDTRIRSVFLAVASACLGVALIGTAPAAAASDPTVISGTHAANSAIPTGSLAEMAKLPLPSGRWFVTAKAVISGVADDLATYSVNCRLTTGVDFDVALATPMNVGSQSSRLPVVLTVVHHFSSPGQAVLACAAHVANSAVIGLISIQAIKLGKLTNGPIGSPGTSSGTGTPTAISAYRDAALFTDKNVFSTPQILPLPPGRWLIYAKAAVSGALTGNILSIVTCQLTGESGSSAWFGDLAAADLTPVGLPGSRTVLAMQTARNVGPSGGLVRFNCSSQQSGHGFSWLKITAIKLGKFTLRNLDTSMSTTVGTGTPRLIHGEQYSPDVISLPSTKYKTVANMSVPAGKWLITAKSVVHGSGGSAPVRVDCRLAGSDDSRVMISFGWYEATLWFQTMHASSSAATIRIRCKRSGSSSWLFEFPWTYLSAMRVGAVTNKTI